MHAEQSPPRSATFLDRFLPGEAAPGQSGIPVPDINLAEIRAMLYRQRRFMLPVALVGPIVAIGITALMPSIYQGDVALKIDNERAQIIEGQDLDPSVPGNETARYLTTQAKIINSRNLAIQVVEQLGLARDDRFIVRMGERPDAPDLPPEQQKYTRENQVIKLLQANVTMVAPVDSRIATISFKSRDRLLAAQVANAYAARYVNLNVLQRYDMNAYARRILTQQVEENRKQLRATEQRAIDYARTNNLIDVGDAASGADNGKGEGGKESGSARSIVTANLVTLNQAYAEAQAARIAAEARWRTVSSANGLELSETIGNSAIQNLMQARAAGAAKLSQLRQHYIDSSPEVQEVKAELATLDGQITVLSAHIRNSVRNDYIDAQLKERNLAEARNALATETLGDQEKRVQLNIIARDADTLRRQVSDLLARLNQLSSAADVNTNNISVIDEAQVPTTPISPNPVRNLLLGIVAGLVLAVGSGLLREMLDETLQSPDDVENKLRLRLLGTVPLASKSVIDELTDSKSSLSEAYHSAQATIDFSSGGRVNKTLMLTSSSPSEGKSTTAYALAQSFARARRRVLVVDADSRMPSLHRLFGVSRGLPGWTDCLLNELPLEQALVRTEDPMLIYLPVGSKIEQQTHLFSSDAIAEFFAGLRAQFDVVIIDAPPVMGLADAPLLSQVTDGVIFVAEAGRAHNGQAKIAIRRLRDNGARVLGAVMTKFDAASSGYGEGSHYYYYDYRYGEKALEEAAAQ